MMKPIVVFFACSTLSLCNASFDIFGVLDHGNSIANDEDGDDVLVRGNIFDSDEDGDDVLVRGNNIANDEDGHDVLVRGNIFANDEDGDDVLVRGNIFASDEDGHDVLVRGNNIGHYEDKDKLIAKSFGEKVAESVPSVKLSIMDSNPCPGKICPPGSIGPGGCCPHKNWYCCPDGLFCAVDKYNCPPETSVSAKNCPCNTLLLSSIGSKKQHYPQVMGHYTRYGVFNNKPSYRGPNSNWLYFLSTGWIVGRHVGDLTGLITNTNKSRSYCAYEIPDAWLIFYSPKWYQEPSLVIRCDVPPYA